MTNYLFKSDKRSDLQIIRNQLEIIQNEQRHQRQDSAAILYLVKKFSIDKNLQTQVDQFHDRFDEDVKPDPDYIKDLD